MPHSLQMRFRASANKVNKHALVVYSIGTARGFKSEKENALSCWGGSQKQDLGAWFRGRRSCSDGRTQAVLQGCEGFHQLHLRAVLQYELGASLQLRLRPSSLLPQSRPAPAALKPAGEVGALQEPAVELDAACLQGTTTDWQP